ncbi:MAG: 50S ribosomal protein L9, partial [Vicingaceae bacterium]
MEVILKEDVEKLGYKDEIVNVKNGYGRNFLIPKGIAVIATSSSKKMLEETKKQRAHKEEKMVAEAESMAEKFIKISIKVMTKAGEK